MLDKLREALSHKHQNTRVKAVELVLSMLGRVKVVDMTDTEVERFVEIVDAMRNM